MRSLEGKVAWITGAGTGIGRAAALALAGGGAHVVLSARRPEPLEAVAEAVREAGGAATVEPLDVSDAAAAAGVAERVGVSLGRLDILVASAGINVPERHWSNLSTAEWTRVVDTNLNGAFHCIKAVLPMMRARGDGLIINISSWAGRQVSYLTGPAYVATKHGMNALNQSINVEEFRHGIRACAICPGEVATEIMDQRPSPPSPEARARMIQPADLGETILFVARMPPHVCINEILVSPTWNRSYVSSPDRFPPAVD